MFWSAFFHHADIFFIAMVEVARYITVNMVDVLIACVAKEIPLAKAFAVFVPGTLALIRRRGGTPEKRHVVHVAMNPLSIIQHGGYVWRNYD